MKFITVLAVLSLALVTACGKNKSGKGDGDRVIGMNGLEVNRPATYQGKCRELKVEGARLYQSSDFTITMNNIAQARFELNTSVFYDKKCTIGLYQTGLEGDGTMTMNNTVLKSDLNRAMIRPMHDEIARSFNQKRLCGRTGWRAFVEMDVTHTKCVEGSRRGDIHFKSSGNGSDLTLFMCDEYQPLSSKCEKVKLTRRF